MLELLQLVNLNLKSFFSHMYSIIVFLSNVELLSSKVLHSIQ